MDKKLDTSLGKWLVFETEYTLVWMREILKGSMLAKLKDTL